MRNSPFGASDEDAPHFARHSLRPRCPWFRVAAGVRRLAFHQVSAPTRVGRKLSDPDASVEQPGLTFVLISACSYSARHVGARALNTQQPVTRVRRMNELFIAPEAASQGIISENCVLCGSCPPGGKASHHHRVGVNGLTSYYTMQVGQCRLHSLLVQMTHRAMR